VKLKQLLVRRFRGIRQLSWTIAGSTICLVGPGDSTKTTILDAIEWVLSPRWSLPSSDADFYGAVTADPILIEATVGEVPTALLSQQKFGLDQRGWGPQGLRDEPEDDDEPVLTVRLTIDDSLEPRWEIVNDRQTEPKAISSRDREALGATRLGADVERHLTRGRGSALLRLTGSMDEMGRTLAEAHRSTREIVNAAELADLKEAAQRAAEIASELGAGARDTYGPGLDPAAMGVGAAAIGLHDGSVPVRAAGLGSRRLAALGIQRASFPEGGILLVDEVEAGLEPHRLRHLIRKLAEADTGQVIMTTHSELSIVELTTAELRVVASENGVTEVRKVHDELQSTIRAAPEALLARRVIVAEGKTELGLCRALDGSWAASHGKPPAEVGVVAIHGGGGDQAAGRAMALASLGYRTALLVDSDRPLNPPQDEIEASGVTVFMWPGGVSTEERVMADLPLEVIRTVVGRARELLDEDVPTAATGPVAIRLGAAAGSGFDDWLAGFQEKQVRGAIAETAKKGWFKGIDLGEALGRIVVDALPLIPQSSVATTLDSLGDWAYAS
jgi:hypothetical protein